MDMTSVFFGATVARMETARGNFGSGLLSSASWSKSAMAWPLPARNLSALAGLMRREIFMSAGSANFGAASDLAGWGRGQRGREHGMFIELGLPERGGPV